jgi:ABC-2 type transport system permease protein
VSTLDQLPSRAAPPTGFARHRAALRWPLELVAFEVKVSSVGSVLGLAWAIAQPLLYLGAYWFLLTVLDARHLGGGGAEGQVLTLLCGLVTWLFFVRSLSGSLSAYARHAGIVRQTNAPVGALPAVSVGVQGVDFLVGMGVVLAGSVATGLVHWTGLLLAPVVALLLVFLIASATLLAPLAVMLRDLRRLVQVSLRVGMFITPVLYLPSALPSSAMFVAYANPAAYFIGLMRYSVTGSEAALLISPAADLAIAFGFTAVLAVLALSLRGRAWRMSVDHI